MPPSADRGGAPPNNINAVKSGLRRRGEFSQESRGSKLPKGCGNVSRHVRGLVDRVKAAWREKHGYSDSQALPVAVDRLVHQVRRAEERDRLAAKQLADGSDLKGNPLTFDQQERLQDAQEAAGKLIEACLRKLGLDLDPSSATTDPWSAPLPDLTRLPPAIPASPPHGLAAVNAPEKPGRFSGDSPPQQSSEAARTP